MKERIKQILKSKEFKILVYFILILIVVIALSRVYLNYLTKINKYNWQGADVDGDGAVGDVEGYAYLFGGFAKDIGGELSSSWKTGITLLPLDIKTFIVPICIVLQIIAVAIKNHKKILSNIALSMNLASSVLAIFVSIFGSIWLIKGIVIFDMLISIILLIYNNKSKNQTKIDLYDLNEKI